MDKLVHHSWCQSLFRERIGKALRGNCSWRYGLRDYSLAVCTLLAGSCRNHSFSITGGESMTGSADMNCMTDWCGSSFMQGGRAGSRVFGINEVRRECV